MAETLSTIGAMVGNDIKDLRIKKLDKEEASKKYLSTENVDKQLVKSNVTFQGSVSINKILEDTFDIRNTKTTDIKEASKIILNLKPVKQISNDKERVGFVSTEIENILPTLITKDDSTVKMEYLKLIPFLVATIQEQQIEINTLKNK